MRSSPRQVFQRKHIFLSDRIISVHGPSEIAAQIGIHALLADDGKTAAAVQGVRFALRPPVAGTLPGRRAPTGQIWLAISNRRLKILFEMAANQRKGLGYIGDITDEDLLGRRPVQVDEDGIAELDEHLKLFRHYAHLDLTTSSMIVEAVLAALGVRDRDGVGQLIEIEMLAAALWDPDLGLAPVRAILEGKKYKVLGTIGRGGGAYGRQPTRTCRASRP